LIFKKRKQQPIFSLLSELKKKASVKSSVNSDGEERVPENKVHADLRHLATNNHPVPDFSSHSRAEENPGKIMSSPGFLPEACGNDSHLLGDCILAIHLKITSAPSQNEKDELPDPDRQAVGCEPFEANDFVYIAPGSFLMGSDEEEFGRHEDEVLHEVTLTRGFYMQVTLVTQKQWKAVMGNNPSAFAGVNLGQPVDGVSWDDCQQFIKKLNSLGYYKYRLPTEAEWEYACRAGTSTTFCNGNISISDDGRDSKLDEVAWYNINSAGKTHPVAQKSPNAWGIYDLHGNLCEWCEDWYGNYPARPQIDPVNTTVASCRTSRGGCWVSTAQNCRSATRFSWAPDHRSDFIGFRLVREEN